MSDARDRLYFAARRVAEANGSSAITSLNCVLDVAHEQLSRDALIALDDLADRLAGIGGHRAVADAQNDEQLKLRAVKAYIAHCLAEIK